MATLLTIAEIARSEGKDRSTRSSFDRATSRERSTYADPLHSSEGILYVTVNRQLVVDGGRITAARPGRALLGPAHRP